MRPSRIRPAAEIIISRAGTPVAKVIPLHPRIKRVGRGSLTGKLIASDDWDSPTADDSIADDFGLTQ